MNGFVIWVVGEFEVEAGARALKGGDEKAACEQAAVFKEIEFVMSCRWHSDPDNCFAITKQYPVGIRCQKRCQKAFSRHESTLYILSLALYCHRKHSSVRCVPDFLTERCELVDIFDVSSLLRGVLVIAALLWIPVISTRYIATAPFVMMLACIMSLAASLILAATSSYSVEALSSNGASMISKAQVLQELYDINYVYYAVFVAIFTMVILIGFGSASKVDERRAMLAVVLSAQVACNFLVALLDNDYSGDEQVAIEMTANELGVSTSQSDRELVFDAYGNRTHASCKDKYGLVIEFGRVDLPKLEVAGLRVKAVGGADHYMVTLYEGDSPISTIDAKKIVGEITSFLPSCFG